MLAHNGEVCFIGQDAYAIIAKPMRRLLTALIVLLAVYLVLSRFTELQQVVDTLGRGQVAWLLLAVVL